MTDRQRLLTLANEAISVNIPDCETERGREIRDNFIKVLANVVKTLRKEAGEL